MRMGPSFHAHGSMVPCAWVKLRRLPFPLAEAAKKADSVRRTSRKDVPKDFGQTGMKEFLKFSAKTFGGFSKKTYLCL